MGTRRRICLWWQRGKHDYCCLPPGWKPERDGEISFSSKENLISFARSGRMILKEKQEGRRHNDQFRARDFG